MAQGGGNVTIPYITDGLIFFVDGKNRGRAAGKVTDLIGGMEFNIKNVTFDSDGGMVFNGSAYLDTAAGYTLPANGDFTVEICFRPQSTAAQYLFGTGDNDRQDRPMVVMLSTRMLTASSRSTSGGIAYSFAPVVNQAYIVSSNHSGGLINGQAATSTTPDYYTPGVTNRTTIGARHNAASTYRTYFTGTIYSVRVYSRRLTTAEMLFNQEIDNDRFNLGLSIS